MTLQFSKPVKASLLITGASALLTGCMGAGGGVPSAGTPITQQEASQGAEYHPQLVAEFGGPMTGPAATYVEGVGKNIAVQSGLGNARESFTVTFLDSSVNNAFAVPGGYVYVTRQLATLMNNEAELAGVLGHEVGHVAARHSQRRQQRAQRNSILGVLGAVVGAVVGGDVGSLLQQGSRYTQLLTLKFSRDQELEADNLGIEYLNKAGYDPRAMGTVLASLAAQNSLDARIQGRGDARPPVWASTHPDPGQRVQRALQVAGNPGGVTNRDTFLSRIDGVIYGDNPRQGVIEGREFIHPDLRLKFAAPGGFYMLNGTRAVSINGQSGQAQFTLAPFDGNLDTYVRSVFQKLGGEQQTLSPSEIRRTTVNGIPAAYGTARVNNQSGQVDVVVFAYEFANDRAYHFMAITKAGGSSVFSPMFQSVQRISSQEAGAVIPRRLDLVTAGRGDTVQSLSNRMAYSDAKVERFRVLNGLSSSDRIIAGQKYKIVIRSN